MIGGDVSATLAGALEKIDGTTLTRARIFSGSQRNLSMNRGYFTVLFAPLAGLGVKDADAQHVRQDGGRYKFQLPRIRLVPL